MTSGESYQGNDLSNDPYFHFIPQQAHNDAPQNAWVPTAPADDQPEGNQESVGGVGGPGGVQDPHYINAAHQGVADSHPQPLGNPAYVFSDMGQAQGIPAQVQPNAPVNQECNSFGYVQHFAPHPVQAAFPHPFAHRIPPPYPPGRAGAENLRQLAGRCFYHPNAQLSMVTMEPATPGRIKVAVVFEAPDGF